MRFRLNFGSAKSLLSLDELDVSGFFGIALEDEERRSSVTCTGAVVSLYCAMKEGDVDAYRRPSLGTVGGL